MKWCLTLYAIGRTNGCNSSSSRNRPPNDGVLQQPVSWSLQANWCKNKISRLLRHTFVMLCLSLRRDHENTIIVFYFEKKKQRKTPRWLWDFKKLLNLERVRAIRTTRRSKSCIRRIYRYKHSLDEFPTVQNSEMSFRKLLHKVPGIFLHEGQMYIREGQM